MANNIFIVGAGIMGVSTALDFAAHGYQVRLMDCDQSQLVKAQKLLKADFREAKMLLPTYRGFTFEQILKKVVFQSTYDGVEHAGVVIENVSESYLVKQKVYIELNQKCRPDTVFGLNTSCISITKLASNFSNPGQVIGVHFMNPVPAKKMVEMIRGEYTSLEAENVFKKILETLGKKAVLIEDMPGFVSNRLSHLFMNEAANLIQDGIASPQQVDEIFREGFGHKMGPLETADLIGLDTVVDSLKVLYESYQDPKFRCCPLLRKKVDAGKLGRKSGEGFYKY